MSYRSLWLAVFGASLFVNACIAPTPSTLTTGGPTVAAVNPIVPTTNLTDGCITTYDPTVDYFPEKATLTHSDGFTLEYFKHYKVITVRTPAPGAEPLQFVLVQCGAPTPPGFAETQISQVPVKSIVVMSSTFVTTLDELNLLDRLVGLDEATYISNAKVLQMADAGQLTMIGVGAGVNVEQALDLQPELIMAVSAGNVEFDAHPKLQEAGLKVVLNAEWMETSPLGRAEWSKFIAAFFNREAAAETLFAERVVQYEELAALASTVQDRPTVFVNVVARGTWSVPGGHTYIARFLADAGADYLWAGETTNERLQLSFEEVYDTARDAQFWVNTGRVATVEELLAGDERYADFVAFQTGNLWNNNARLGPNGGNEYWEVGVVHPEIVLADLITIFHPELLPDHELVYYLAG